MNEYERESSQNLGESRELVDDIVDRLRERGKRWNHIMALKNQRLSENYLRKDARLFLVYGIEGARPEYVAILERQVAEGNWGYVSDVTGTEQVLQTGTAFAGQTIGINFDHVIGGENDEQEPVLIHDVQIVNDTEILVVPSEVRLARAKDLFDITPRTLYLPPHEGFVLGGGWVSLLPPDGVRGVLARIGHNGPGDVIEHRAQGVNHVSDPEADLRRDLGRCRLIDPHDQVRMAGLFGRLRVFIEGDTIGVLPLEDGELGLKFFDLFVGPTETGVCAREIKAHDVV